MNVDLATIWSTTLILAGSAYVVALLTTFLSPRMGDKYYRPQLHIKFKFGMGSLHSHQTTMKMRQTRESFPVYYFLFSVVNDGVRQADDCEAILEKIWEEDSAGELQPVKEFIPVNLKWSGEDPDKDFRGACFKTIYPKGREIFCDIARIKHPSQKDRSAWRGLSEEDQQKNKFFFELPRRYFCGWDCLMPSKYPYHIQISAYSKNGGKATEKFKIRWSGNWEDTEEKMFKEIVISKNVEKSVYLERV